MRRNERNGGASDGWHEGSGQHWTCKRDGEVDYDDDDGSRIGAVACCRCSRFIGVGGDYGWEQVSHCEHRSNESPQRVESRLVVQLREHSQSRQRRVAAEHRQLCVDSEHWQ
jgi:hypothetical protein